MVGVVSTYIFGTNFTIYIKNALGKVNTNRDIKQIVRSHFGGSAAWKPV